jgi:hypothetical protein
LLLGCLGGFSVLFNQFGILLDDFGLEISGWVLAFGADQRTGDHQGYEYTFRQIAEFHVFPL